MSANDLIHLESHYKQWLGTRGQGLPKKLEPFNYYCIEQFMKQFDLSDEEILNGITDGGNDGGADAMYFLVNRDVVWEDTSPDPKTAMTVDLVFFQVKSSQGFQHTEIDKLVFLTDDFLDLSKPCDPDMALKYNPKVLELMSVFKDKYPPISGNFPTITVKYYYITKADEATPHPNAVNSGKKVASTVQKHLSKADASFNFVNAQRLLEQIQTRLPDTRELVWDETPMTTNEGYVGLVALPDYFKFIQDTNGELARRIFESNVRGWQENTSVNKQIRTSLASDSSINFWLLNNGITILASKTATAGPKRLSVKGPQVVNGLQTSREIYDYYAKKSDSKTDKRSILVRVIETEDPDLFDVVVKATNSQNKMPPASLRATDQIHRQVEELFKQYDLYYDRRKGVHKDEGRPVGKIVAVTEVLQAVVSMLLQRPDDARARPGNYISDDDGYEEVFGSDKYSLILYLKVTQIMRSVESFLQGLELEYGDRRNIKFYVAACVGCELTKSVSPTATALAAIDLKAVSNELIGKCFERVWKKYQKLGANDNVSKGPDLIKKLHTDIKRKFSKQSPKQIAAQ